MSRLSDFQLKDYIDKWNIQNMVETGTYKGDGIRDALKAGITHIFSCDVEPSFMKGSDLHNNPGVHLYIDRSTNCLPDMLVAAGPEPTLIFFDAHCDPKLFDTKLANVDTDDGEPLPLLMELELLIKNRDVSNDVIIIDDMHLYVEEMAVQRFDGWSTTLPPINFKTKEEMVEVVSEYLPNHNVKIVQVHDISLHCTPKD